MINSGSKNVTKRKSWILLRYYVQPLSYGPTPMKIGKNLNCRKLLAFMKVTIIDDEYNAMFVQNSETKKVFFFGASLLLRLHSMDCYDMIWGQWTLNWIHFARRRAFVRLISWNLTSDRLGFYGYITFVAFIIREKLSLWKCWLCQLRNEILRHQTEKPDCKYLKNLMYDVRALNVSLSQIFYCHYSSSVPHPYQ